MALQPAAGARDLNPLQVERNRVLSERLAAVYRLWGYDEVSPPRVERLDTLMAGGAIAIDDVVRLVADDPLGLRPEMTASIARAACTRLASRPRPLRLWAFGTVFQSRSADEGGTSIEENLHSGVELFGIKGIEAEMELLSLLIAAVKTLDLTDAQRPQLLIGHTALMDLVLKPYVGETREAIRSALVRFDRLAIEAMDLALEQRELLLLLLDSRGTPQQQLDQLETLFGSQPVFRDLMRLSQLLEPAAGALGLTLQLDTTFQPEFKLYTGLVFQLVCQGTAAPVVIARGGRYDDLVRRCGARGDTAAGVGFSLAIDPIRELLSDTPDQAQPDASVLVAFSANGSLETALHHQQTWHQQGRRALVELSPLADRQAAEALAKDRQIHQLDWIDS
tara:strand:+ start:842 stop:2020 length:1179 start_codon:yes stop_codon:yes gene_type:complete